MKGPEIRNNSLRIQEQYARKKSTDQTLSAFSRGTTPKSNPAPLVARAIKALSDLSTGAIFNQKRKKLSPREISELQKETDDVCEIHTELRDRGHPSTRFLN